MSSQNNPYSYEVGDDQEVVIGTSGRAIINGQEISIDEDDAQSKHSGICPTWLSGTSPRMKCLLSTAALLFVAFISMTVVGITGMFQNNEEVFENAQYQEAIEDESTNNAATNSPTSRPSATQNEILTVPIDSSQILIAFPNELEAKLQQIDFSDGLNSSEQTHWGAIETSIEETIAITLFGRLTAEYEVGAIEIESIDENAISGGGDSSSYIDTIHTVIYSSSVIVDCAISDCNAAPNAIDKVFANVGLLESVDAVGDFAAATTSAPLVTDSTDNIDYVDEVDMVDQVETAATTTSTQASVDQVDEVDTVDTVVAETGSPTATPTKPPVTEAPTTDAPTYPPTVGGPIPLDDASCSSSTPCSECLGACSSDSDCTNGLLCFKRLYWDNIPGCEGPGRQGQSYCYDPYAEGLSKDVLLSTKNSKCGDDGSRCGKCQGDCQNDNDCDKSLYCYQRFGYELVPGCAGQGAYQQDYCFDPSDIPGNNEGVSSGGPPNGNVPN